jgi:hypothetical protein
VLHVKQKKNMEVNRGEVEAKVEEGQEEEAEKDYSVERIVKKRVRGVWH